MSDVNTPEKPGDTADYIERYGKTAEDAIADALKQLGKTREEVDVTVLEEGARGFLGLNSKPAKVRVCVKPDPMGKAKKFLKEAAAAIGVVIEVTARIEENHMYAEIAGEDIGVFIGKRGQTLDSLQYLTGLVVNRGSTPYINVTLDAENYRARRKETLEILARNIAKRVKQTRRNVVLEPMSPNERRIIHSTLQGEKNISTHSEGDEPFRYVVVTYKSDERGPYNPGKQGRRGGAPYGGAKPAGQARGGGL